MAIIVVEHGGKAKSLEPSRIENEDYLQRYIHEHPDAVPIDDVKPGARLLVIAREFPTSAGPIDALAIDGEGDVYVIETKLYKNPDKRRVIAQMMDYGAALWSGNAEAELFAALSRESLAGQLADYFSLDESGTSAVIDNILENVSKGTFRFIVLMDQISESLRTLIRFVNEKSSFSVIGVELDFYNHASFDILIPRTYGAESQKQGPVTSGRRAWTEERCFAQVNERIDPKRAAAVRELYDHMRGIAPEVRFVGGAVYGGFTVHVPELHERPLFKVTTDGDVVIRMNALGDVGIALRDDLERSGSFRIPHDKKEPTLLLDDWYPVRETLTKVIAAFIESRDGKSTAASPDL